MAIAAPPSQRIYTADDLLAMPEDLRVELVRGELIPMPPPPGGEHGNLTERVGARATVFVEDNDLGYTFTAETGFLVSRNPDSVKAPDWAFVAKARLPDQVTEKHVPVVPDLLLETRSPSDTRREVAYKIEIWLAAGVRMVWELDPDRRQITVHRPNQSPQFLSSTDTLSGEDVLPGFQLPLSKVFR